MNEGLRFPRTYDKMITKQPAWGMKKNQNNKEGKPSHNSGKGKKYEKMNAIPQD